MIHRPRSVWALVLLACVGLGLFASPTSAQSAGKLVGTYTPDGKCVPSSTCCCSTGPMSISSQPPNDSVNVNGDLDGGTGCHGFTSLQAVFQVRTFNRIDKAKYIYISEK